MMEVSQERREKEGCFRKLVHLVGCHNAGLEAWKTTWRKLIRYKEFLIKHGICVEELQVLQTHFWRKIVTSHHLHIMRNFSFITGRN